jgi:hypothetical protein
LRRRHREETPNAATIRSLMGILIATIIVGVRMGRAHGYHSP